MLNLRSSDSDSTKISVWKIYCNITQLYVYYNIETTKLHSAGAISKLLLTVSVKY